MALATAPGSAQSAAVRESTDVARSPYMERLSFGELVRRRRRARGITQEQLAEQVGTNKAYISRLEGNVEKQPGHEMAQRIIVALEADAAPFLLALGYPVQADERPDWRRLLWDDDRLSDEDKRMLDHFGELAITAKRIERERREQPEKRKAS